jgi:hypothetical protein
MSACKPFLVPAAAVPVIVAALAFSGAAYGQVIATTPVVCGISIDPNGVLDNATVDALGELQRLRAKSMGAVPKAMAPTTELRKISLRRLEAAIQKCLESGKPLPDEIKYLAGLQQIRYVFVYPEQQDIVLVGPGEGWKLDGRGNVVGATTGWPVMLLDDLVVALRSARAADQTGISCSIDPTPEGLTQLKEHVSKVRTIGDRQRTAAGIEEALGRQQITLTGVPATSHFARVLVAADYRMKRLAMNFEPAPVRGLPGFLQMIEAGRRGMRDMLPRWWLAPDYQSTLRDPDGLAWELRGASVKAMTEDDFLTATGGREHTGKSDPVAQRWADNMTAAYDRLAVAEPIFGQVRNCADLAIVAALIQREKLAERAGYSMTVLMDSSQLRADEYFAPQQVDSRASLLKKGSNWVIGVSGGVRILPRSILEKTETSDKLGPVRAKASLLEHDDWWWN